MASNLPKRPYEDLSDIELVTTWRKRDNEYTDFYLVPRLEGKLVDFKRSQDFCGKLDRLEDELRYRGLYFTQRFYEIDRPGGGMGY